MRVEQEVAQPVHEAQVALAVRQVTAALLRRFEQLAFRCNVLSERSEAREHVLVAPTVGRLSEPAPAEELPPRGRPFDPDSFAATAAEYGIELLGPPGALPRS